MVPSDDFRAAQQAQVPRAGALGHTVSDPARAQRNRVERDRLIAADAVARARRLGITVLTVDGTKDAERVADEVADRFAAFLPATVRR